MIRLVKSNKLHFPLISETNKTYLSPILGKKDDFDLCYKLAEGWKYFKYVNVIQNISGRLYKKILTKQISKGLSKIKNKKANGLYAQEKY